MIDLSTIQLYFDYNYWAHRRVWECILTLSDEQFTHNLGYSLGSIHAQVVHVMSGEWVWLTRLRGYMPTAMLKTEAYPTREAVRARWDEIEADVRGYLPTLTAVQMNETLTYRTMTGGELQNRYGEILLHVINHGTDHRAQILAMLHQLGAPTVEQDLIFYLREKAKIT